MKFFKITLSLSLLVNLGLLIWKIQEEREAKRQARLNAAMQRANTRRSTLPDPYIVRLVTEMEASVKRKSNDAPPLDIDVVPTQSSVSSKEVETLIRESREAREKLDASFKDVEAFLEESNRSLLGSIAFGDQVDAYIEEYQADVRRSK